MAGVMKMILDFGVLLVTMLIMLAIGMGLETQHFVGVAGGGSAVGKRESAVGRRGGQENRKLVATSAGKTKATPVNKLRLSAQNKTVEEARNGH